MNGDANGVSDVTERSLLLEDLRLFTAEFLRISAYLSSVPFNIGGELEAGCFMEASSVGALACLVDDERASLAASCLGLSLCGLGSFEGSVPTGEAGPCFLCGLVGAGVGLGGD